MPPRVKVSEEAIIEAALQIAREHGIAQINARELAKALGCSIQPIFRTFKSMENLRKALYEKVSQVYEEHVMQGLAHAVRPSLGVGLAYIDFARREKNLFKFLFMSDEFKVQSLFEMIQGDDNHALIGVIAQSSGLGREAAAELFLTVWLVTHGIASMMATNTCDFDDVEVERILDNTFKGVTMQLKKLEKAGNSEVRQKTDDVKQ